MVQIWPGLIVCKQVTVCPGHIWTTLYLPLHWLNSAGVKLAVLTYASDYSYQHNALAPLRQWRSFKPAFLSSSKLQNRATFYSFLSFFFTFFMHSPSLVLILPSFLSFFFTDHTVVTCYVNVKIFNFEHLKTEQKRLTDSHDYLPVLTEFVQVQVTVVYIYWKVNTNTEVLKTAAKFLWHLKSQICAV